MTASAKAALAPYVSPAYPPFDMDIPDKVRADAWLAEFRDYVAKGSMPAFEMLWLPADHTARNSTCNSACNCSSSHAQCPDE